MDPSTLPPSAAHVHHAGSGDGAQIAGVVVVFSGGAPGHRVMALDAGPLELGRGEAGPGRIDDGRISRRHAVVMFEAGRCVVTDLGSQNGSVVDGELIAARVPTPVARVLRIGDSLVLPCADVRPFERDGVAIVDGFVRGPAMHAILAEAARAAHDGAVLHVRGESGSGKEGVVQTFHRAARGAGKPLIAVNCAAIPHALAERLLFGAKRGAYSGADADVPGYLQEADGGTLFLDEIAELDLQVQAKLLRVLESRELLALGASKPRKVDFALCSATNKDLRALVAAGAMREDLYFRIGRPGVTLPALRKRPEEIPALIAYELSKLPSALLAHVSLVEQCLLRPWPGNVRELLSEIRIAAQAARTHGRRVTACHLAATAGRMFGDAASQATLTAPDGQTAPPDALYQRMPQVDDAWYRRIEDALRANAGNASATARALGLNRNLPPSVVGALGAPSDAAPGAPAPSAPRSPEQAADRERIVRALADCAGNQTRAARQLGISRTTLITKLRIYHIARPST